MWSFSSLKSLALLAGLVSAQVSTISSSASVTLAGASESVAPLPIVSTTSVSAAPSLASSQAQASASVAAVGGQTVANTILVFARDTTSAYSATSGLNGYGIPYQLVIVPQAGITLPTLNSSATQGNYGGFIILSEVSYDYSTGWGSAITNDQMNALYAYQTAFGVRMVRLDVYPESSFGTATAIASAGCCSTGVEQLVSISNSTGFPTANIKTGAGMSTQAMWHYPAVITDPSTTWEIAQFAPSADGTFSNTTTAAVINNFGGRLQMVWFTSWATSWSPTSNFLQHAHIHWMTRGLFVGSRKMYFSTQIDDVHLKTQLYTPNNTNFRITPSDISPHIAWMKSLNTRLPAGSSYMIELGHNGNGDIDIATNLPDGTNPGKCSPDTAVYYADQNDTALEFQKPLGTGTDLWPTTPTSYVWSVACAKVDALAAWFMTATNRDAFSHISHTFTHENLDNATYNDANKEIFFNVAWLKQVGISAGKFSSKGLIPPAITGMHNGDVIHAWMTNGITAVVGDNSRPVLLNTQNEYWPLITTVAGNGYAGLTVMPRWPTAIYYNCNLANCTTLEWVQTSGGVGGFTDLLKFETTVETRHLLALHQDPFMFHQANLATVGVPSYTVGSVSGQLSLLQIWVETITQEMSRLTNWPLVTLKHDDLAVKFTQRMTRDSCNPNLAYSYSADGKHITGVTVTATGNTCGAPIGVTFPGPATSKTTTTKDQLGSEPLIMWANLTGSPVTYTLTTPIAV